MALVVRTGQRAGVHGASRQQRRQAARQAEVARTNRATRAQRSGASALDAPAQQWARLLLDPCYGRLAHPIYPGGDGGLLCRFESEITMFNGATETGGIFGWIPGALPTGSWVAGVTTDISATTLTTGFAAYQPGYAFLQSSASAVRCVSACIQVAWPGSELNRQGFITLGQCTGAVLTEAGAGFGATATTVANLRPLCHLRSRVPETMAEVKWRPALGDAQWTDPSVSTGIGHINECGALLLTASNLPVATGIRVRMVATYEWVPKSAQGLTSAFDNRSRSKSTLDDVINRLDAAGPGWAFSIGRATSVLGSMREAYMFGRNMVTA